MAINLKIAVCDDEKNQLDFLAELVKKWAIKENVAYTLSLYGSAEEFWLGYGKNCFDIALLDIQMNAQSGMELAKELRSRGDDISIIFTTGLTDYIGEGYNVNAVNYLIKPISEEKLFSALSIAAEKSRNTDNRKLLFETDGETVALFENDIEYIEAFSHSTSLFTKTEHLEIPLGINSVFEKLSKDRFIKCHRSYAVNLKNVKLIKKYEVVLDSGKTVPVSRRVYGDVNKAFIRYYKGEM